MKRFETFKDLTKYIGSVKSPLIALSCFKVFSFILGIIPLFLYSFFVNRVLINKNISMIWYIITGYLTVFLLETIIVAWSKKFSNRLLLKYDLKLKNKLLKKYSEIPNGKYGIGDVRNLIEKDSIIAGNFFIEHILNYLYYIIYAIVLAAILLFYDWRISLISFIFIPVAFSTIDFLGQRTKKTGEELRELQVEYDTFLHDSFQNWKDIKINNLEDAQFDDLNRHYKKIRRIWFINKFYLHIGVTFSFFSKNFITQLFIYIIGGFFAIKGYTQVGTLLVFIKFYGQFFGYIQRISESMMHFNNDSVSIEKVIELINYKIENKPYKKIEGSDIIADELKFLYDSKSAFLLDEVSFMVKRGEHLGIVGESGSGKSTIAKLLTGQIKPEKGNISIGRVDINTVNSRSIFEKIGIVAQEPVFFNMTIRENLLLAKSNVFEQEMIEACTKASIYDFIKTLPDSFDTIIGEKGIKLSGGQKQRLALARVFLQDRDIIIFDESTSALDSEKENDIITELKKLATGKTIISIAHRLSTILDCDMVMVIKDGRIVGLDTHENLRKRNEAYNILFRNQYTVK